MYCPRGKGARLAHLDLHHCPGGEVRGTGLVLHRSIISMHRGGLQMPSGHNSAAELHLSQFTKTAGSLKCRRLSPLIPSTHVGPFQLYLWNSGVVRKMPLLTLHSVRTRSLLQFYDRDAHMGSLLPTRDP